MCCSSVNAVIVIKSTVPVGFVNAARFELNKLYSRLIFAEAGHYRYTVAHHCRRAIENRSFANLLLDGSSETEVLSCILTREAAIKLFANTYLAMRISSTTNLIAMHWQGSGST